MWGAFLQALRLAQSGAKCSHVRDEEKCAQTEQRRGRALQPSLFACARASAPVTRFLLRGTCA